MPNISYTLTVYFIVQLAIGSRPHDKVRQESMLPTRLLWRILRFLHRCPGIYIGKSGACRRFIEGVLWIARTGSQWRELPDRYGKWNSVYKLRPLGGGWHLGGPVPLLCGSARQDSLSGYRQPSLRN